MNHYLIITAKNLSEFSFLMVSEVYLFVQANEQRCLEWDHLDWHHPYQHLYIEGFEPGTVEVDDLTPTYLQ